MPSTSKWNTSRSARRRRRRKKDDDEFPGWQDVRDSIVAEAGGEQAVTEARHRNQAYIRKHLLTLLTEKFKVLLNLG